MKVLTPLWIYIYIQVINSIILPRQPAPKFEATGVVDQVFKRISLDDYIGKYLVLLFYPFDFTYVCPTELIAFSDTLDQFQGIGTEIISINTDSHFTHLAWKNIPRDKGGVQGIKFPMLSDISKDIARAYGTLVEDQSDQLYGISLRGLFIIDRNGIIRMSQISDTQAGRNVQEVLRLVQAFQYTDQYGEVCPAGWKPGQKTIKPNQQHKIEYFQAQFTKEEL